MTRTKRIGPMLRLVLGAGAVMSPLAAPLLDRRLARGKEDPDRWREKLGDPSAPRPDGTLIWLHGVGVGEVMALRGLIAALSEARPDLRFLVTSSARTSGEVFARNLPPRTTHQFLPLDLPGPVAGFLDHWQPDLAVWSDQEVWPRLATTCARRGIPQAYVAARITDVSARARGRFGRAYGDLYGLMDVIHAQDAGTAGHLQTLMDGGEVQVTGSLKAAAAPLADAPAAQALLGPAPCTWVAAPAHPADVKIALDAQRASVHDTGPDWRLIIAPRDMAQVPLIAQACDERGLSHSIRSENSATPSTAHVLIADSFGELGAWYRAASAALIGGTFDAVEGHNPWEAAALDCAILHGPRVANFAADFAQLQAADAARQVHSAQDVVAALAGLDLPAMAARAQAVRAEAAQGVAQISDDLLALLAR